MADAAIDYSGFVHQDSDGRNSLSLAVEGMHCAGCAFKIEKAIHAESGVEARVNVTRRRLKLVWSGAPERASDLLSPAAALGFRFSPLSLKGESDTAQKTLLKCMAVSGFASGNIMIFSLALWFTTRDTMGGATRDLMHWLSALVALPAVVYAGRPFFYSAWKALTHARTNMDVPISVAVILACAMSLFETIRHGEHVYFDSATMLLFLLLCGRYLDSEARGRARAAAHDLVSLMGGVATVTEGESLRRLPAADLKEGMLLHVAAGERILADGRLETGETEMDTSAITGETAPRFFRAGDDVLGGMLNMGQPVQVRVIRAGARSLMGEITRLMEKAEQGNAAYVRMADRISGWYTPTVHLLALITFAGWVFYGAPWQVALMNGLAVLIITCPCALGLAVPVVQVLASGRLFRRGVLLKAADALERLEKVDTVVFDKTGTLTDGALAVTDAGGLTESDLRLCASLAAQSAHPYARAVAKMLTGPLVPLSVREIPGQGIEAVSDGITLRLGSAAFVGAAPGDGAEVWFRKGKALPQRLTMTDQLRRDAAQIVDVLKTRGYHMTLLSGDRPEQAERIGHAVSIIDIHGGADPRKKIEILDRYARNGKHVLMVGDGLNDAPSLTHAFASMSPSSALEIAQNAADVVFQGKDLAPVAETLSVARLSQRLVRQNFILSFAYNIIAVPLAMAGLVTPLIAAVAMSSSSLLVTLNAFRLNRMKG